jgi:two-component system, OmpR family, alkaline phosphatase synthesis response regulator PhoP
MRDKRILVVDDDDAIRLLLKTVLRRRGFTVDTARNGFEALERMGTARYALILLDVMMPVMSGYDLLERLRDRAAPGRPRVLLLSAGNDLRSFDADLVVGSMHKPFDIELLVGTVVGCLSGVSEYGDADESGQKRGASAAVPASELN